MITFEPLWSYLKSKNITVYDLEYDFGHNPAEISRLKNNHNFTLRKINSYCEMFCCSITDIIAYIPDSPESKPDITVQQAFEVPPRQASSQNPHDK